MTGANGTQDGRPAGARSAVLIATAGWLLLIAGLMILEQENAPQWLKTFDRWVQPYVSDFHVDAPMPAGTWLSGSLLLIAGMVLVGRMGDNGLSLADGFPVAPKGERASDDAPTSLWWLALVFAGNVIWLGTVIAAGRHSTHWSLVPLWWVAIVVQGVCWWRADRFVMPRLRLPGRWLPVAGLVIALAVVLYRLGDVPNSIWGDEGAFWAAARDLAAGARVNPFSLGVYGAYPLISSLYQSLWLRLFGPTLWSWRLGSVVAGTLTIIPLFLLVKKLLGPRVAWSAVVLMVSKPYFLAFTRMGYNNIQPLLPITVGLWLLVSALQGYSHVLAYLSGIALGVASLTYTAGYVGSVIAVLFLLLLLNLVRGEKPLRRSMIRLALCLGIGWLFAAGPFFLGNALSGNLMGGKGAESFFGSAFYGETLFSPAQLTRLYPLQHVGQHRIFFEPRLYALLVVRGVLRTGLSMVADRVATQHYLVGPLAGPGGIFFLAGLAWALRRLRRWQAALWIIWTLSCVLLLSVFNTFPPRATHLVPIIPALAVLTAVGIWSLSRLLRRILRCLWADWVAVGLTVALALWGFHTYFTVMPRRYVPDLQNVMFWRAQEMGPGSKLVFVADTPYPADFTVRDIDEFRLGVDHHSLPPDQVGTTDFRALCGHVDALPDPACRVFFLPGEDADAVEAELRRQLGDGTVQMHTDAAGWPVGLEFVPEYSRSRPQSGFWRSDLYWNGLLALGALLAILLSPVSVRALYTEVLSHVSRATTAIGTYVISLRNRWASRMVPALFVGCLGCAILGQAYFARDFLVGRQKPGPNLWPGLFFYALSIVYLLLLGEMIQVPVKTGKNVSVLPVFSPVQPNLVRHLWSGLWHPRWRIGLLCGALITGVGLLCDLSRDLSHRSAGASYVLPFVLWILMMGLYLAAFAHTPSWIWRRTSFRRTLEWGRTHSAELGIVLLLIAIAFLFRVAAVGSIPYSVGSDEALLGLRATEFLDGTRTNMFAPGEWRAGSSLAHFSLALLLALLGRTITGLRMLAVFAGTASVLLTYLLARQFLGRQTALISAFLLATQHYHLHFSRLGSNHVFDTLFTPLLAYLLVRGLQRQRPGLFAAAGLTLGLAQYFSPGARMLPVLLVTVVAYLALARRDLLRENLTNFGILGLGAVLAFLPLGMYEIGYHGDGNGSLLGRVPQVGLFHAGWLAGEMQQSGRRVLQILGDGFLRSSLAFNYFTDRSHWYRSSIPFLDPVSAVLFVMGLITAMRRVFRKVGYFLVVAWFWLAIIWGGILTLQPPVSERLVIVAPALAVLVALGFTQLVECGKIVATWFVPVSRVFPFMVTVVLMAINVGYYFLNYTPTRTYGAPTAELMTRLSRELDTSQKDGKVYFFGAPDVFYEPAPVLRFLIPELVGVDVPEHWTGDLSFVDTSLRAWFVFLPERLDELDVVRTEYPRGTEVPAYSSADGRLLYVLYEFSGIR